MRISEVVTSLSGEDILSIINDFIKIDGLNLTKVNIMQGIELEGEFKKIVSLGFNMRVEVVDVRENKLTIRIVQASLMSLGIFKPFRKLALRIALKGFKDKGVFVESDKVIIDINKVLKPIPFLKLNLNTAWVEGDMVKVRAESINISISNIKSKDMEINVLEDSEKENDDKKEDYNMNIKIEKIKDGYTQGRTNAIKKLPEKAKPYSEYILIMPDIIALIWRVFKDKRVPKKTKIAVATSLGYVVMPYDILPDKLPFIGSIDDIAIVFFALNRILEDVPLNVILENWQGRDEFIVVLKQGFEYLINFTGAKNIDKIYAVIEELY